MAVDRHGRHGTGSDCGQSQHRQWLWTGAARHRQRLQTGTAQATAVDRRGTGNGCGQAGYGTGNGCGQAWWHEIGNCCGQARHGKAGQGWVGRRCPSDSAPASVGKPRGRALKKASPAEGTLGQASGQKTLAQEADSGGRPRSTHRRPARKADIRPGKQELGQKDRLSQRDARLG